MTRYLVDDDRQREQRMQSKLLDRIEARYRPAFAREIAKGMREMIDTYELTGDVMPPRGLYDAIEATFQKMAVASTSTFGGRILQQGKASGKVLERKEDFAATMLRMALLYVAQEAVRRKITSITDTTRAQIVAQVDRGYQDGLGQREIAKAISARVPTISRMRGAMIARTEVHGAANYGAQVAAKETGLELRKEWVSAADERTRQTHADADEQVVGMNDAFDIGGTSLQFPGDPSGPASEVINCRCAVAYITVD